VLALDERSVLSALDERANWPNFAEAANIVGLSKGTLSKRAQSGQIEYEVLGLGQGRHVLSPQEVLRIASRYQRVPRATVIDRLARFLSAHVRADPGLLRRVLWRLAEGASAGTPILEREVAAQSNLSSAPSPEGPETRDETPVWLLEVERLRADPAALAGTLSFASADDLIGTFELGPSVDEDGAFHVGAWPERW
jgi:hypothetical protein